VFKDFIAYLRTHRKLWLLPFAVIVGLAVLLAVVIQVISVSPFIYTLF